MTRNQRLLILSLFGALSLSLVSSYFNSLAVKSLVGWTIHVVNWHDLIIQGPGSGHPGGMYMRWLVPWTAELLRQAFEALPALKLPFLMYYGRESEISSTIFAYVTLHFFVQIWVLVGVLTFCRSHLKLSIGASLLVCILFNVYETFCLTGFITGRPTDISTPGFLIWSMHYLLQKRWVAATTTLFLFSMAREVSIFLVPWACLLLAFRWSTTERKEWIKAVTLTLVIVGGSRIALFWFYRDVDFTDNSSSIFGSLLNGIRMNLSDSNTLKFPLIMHNALWIVAWLGWKNKPDFVKATAILAPLIILTHLSFGSSGEAWGRDLPALLCFLISAAATYGHVLESDSDEGAQA